MRLVASLGGVALVTTLSACGGSEPTVPSAGMSMGGSIAGGGVANGAGGPSGGGMALGGGGSHAGGDAAGAGTAAGGAEPDCIASPSTLPCAPLGVMPASLKATGLFPALPDWTQHAPGLREYAPDPALWSDGMEKQRFLLLPKGTKIDTTNRKQWVFPEGTLFVKTFFDETGPQASLRPIETRLIRAAAGSAYEFFVYQWNQDSTDATLVVNDLNGDINANVSVMVSLEAVNGGTPFSHTLPSRNECGQCHEKNAVVAQTIIGFDELRLNTKLRADAPRTQLQAFADAGLFTQPLPAEPATITDASNDGGRLLRIKRFVFGNCVSCHNGDSQFDLRPDVFVTHTVGKPTEAQSVMPPEGWLRVVPGDASKSVFYVQMQRTMLPPEVNGRRLRAMPPIGLNDVAAEQSVLEDVRQWITSLPGDRQ